MTRLKKKEPEKKDEDKAEAGLSAFVANPSLVIYLK